MRTMDHIDHIDHLEVRFAGAKALISIVHTALGGDVDDEYQVDEYELQQCVGRIHDLFEEIAMYVHHLPAGHGLASTDEASVLLFRGCASTAVLADLLRYHREPRIVDDETISDLLSDGAAILTRAMDLLKGAPSEAVEAADGETTCAANFMAGKKMVVLAIRDHLALGSKTGAAQIRARYRVGQRDQQMLIKPALRALLERPEQIDGVAAALSQLLVEVQLDADVANDIEDVTYAQWLRDDTLISEPDPIPAATPVRRRKAEVQS